MIRVAVLDMAGTTVRDEGVVAQAFRDALLAVDYPRVDLAHGLRYAHDTMGRSKADVFAALLDHDTRRVDDALRAFEESYASAVELGSVTAIAGAEAAIGELRRGGVAVVLTTGFSRRTCDLLLERIGWVDLVDGSVVPGPDVRGRPHPDLVLAAAKVAGVDDPTEIAVAGDTANDLEAGARAGASIVAGVLTGAHDRSELESAPHTHLLESVAELPGVIARRQASKGGR